MTTIPERRAAPRLQARALWLKLHLYLGLTVGLVLALIGLTGSLLVVQEPLWRLAHGDVLFGPTPRDAPHAPVGEWIANARARFPELVGLDFVAAPGATPVPSTAALVGSHVDPADAGGAHKHAMVAVDPYTAEPLGFFVAEDGWAGVPLFLHVSLMLPFGAEVVAWSGVALLVSVVTGFYLWWPRGGRLRAALWFGRRTGGGRRPRELHNVAAVYLLPVIVPVTLTGVYLLKPGWIDPVVSLASPVAEPDPAAMRVSPAGACGGTGLAPEAAVEVAKRAAPRGELRLLAVPEEPDLPFEVWLRRPGDANPRLGDVRVWVDPRCPRALVVKDAGALGAGETFKNLALPLHDGTRFGAAGEALVFLAGLSLPVLYATGLLMWLRRRRARAVAPGYSALGPGPTAERAGAVARRRKNQP